MRKYYLNPNVYHATLGILSELPPLHVSLLSRLIRVAIVWQDLDSDYLLGTVLIL